MRVHDGLRAATATIALVGTMAGACQRTPPDDTPRASGYIEGTDVQVSSKVAGRVIAVKVVEGQRVAAGDVVVALDTTETDLALVKAKADRAQAEAEWRLLEAGSRPEDIAQAEAQVAAATADRRSADAEVTSARTDETRFDQLLKASAGSRKEYDDAVERRERAEAAFKAADDRRAAAAALVDRLKAGSRPEEIEAARAKVAAADAAIATLVNDRAEAVIAAPLAGIVSSRLVEPGELVGPRTPLLVMLDLDHVWANAYVEEPFVPRLRLDQPATVATDAGDRVDGRVTFISSEAEFTPRNVQTTDERAKLVYRVKVAVDNAKGLFKPGVPVEVRFTGAAGGGSPRNPGNQ
jgi:HlyD family secretion protein